jgi:hypothetical protein
MSIEIKDSQGNIEQRLNTVNSDTLTDARPNTSNLASVNAEILIGCSTEDWFSIDVRNTFVGTMSLWFSVDGSTYIQLPAIWNPVTLAYQSTITTTGVYGVANVTGAKFFKVIMTAYTSGAAIVAVSGNTGLMVLTIKPITSSTSVTNTGASGAGVTATLASSTGLFHFITQIRIEKFAVTTLTAGATPVLGTTTNLPGARAYSFDASAQVQGTLQEKIDRFPFPLKSVVSGTATTIVLPAITNVIWRVTVDYYLDA